MLTCTPGRGTPRGSVTVNAIPDRGVAGARRVWAGAAGRGAGVGAAVCANDASPAATNKLKQKSVIARIDVLCLYRPEFAARPKAGERKGEGIITEAARGILHGIEKHPWNLPASQWRWRVRLLALSVGSACEPAGTAEAG